MSGTNFERNEHGDVFDENYTSLGILDELWFFDFYSNAYFADYPWPRIATTQEQAVELVDKLLRFCQPHEILTPYFHNRPVHFTKDILLKAVRRELKGLSSVALYDKAGNKVAMIESRFQLLFFTEPYNDYWDKMRLSKP
jgi:hypothetical protein